MPLSPSSAFLIGIYIRDELHPQSFISCMFQRKTQLPSMCIHIRFKRVSVMCPLLIRLLSSTREYSLWPQHTFFQIGSRLKKSLFLPQLTCTFINVFILWHHNVRQNIWIGNYWDYIYCNHIPLHITVRCFCLSIIMLYE